MFVITRRHLAFFCGTLLVLTLGCTRSPQQGGKQSGGERDKKVIRVEGSDTMVNIAQAWLTPLGSERATRRGLSRLRLRRRRNDSPCSR